MSFASAHAALLLRRARRYCAEGTEKISPEDTKRELEIILGQLEKDHSLADVECPDLLLRELVRFAAGRAKRRTTLIGQIAAGDDLQAVSEELRTLDADLPRVSGVRNQDAKEARARLDKVRDLLHGRVRVIFSLLIEDGLPLPEFAFAISASPSEMEEAKTRILRAAQEAGIEAELDRREAPSTSVDDRRYKKLLALATIAGADGAQDGHIEDPILALVRSGDSSDDLADAHEHLGACVDCRARLETGDVERRSLVVMAIEAPRGSQRDLVRAAEGAGATLQERGEGRWTAVVDAGKAESFKDTLEKTESSVITRIAVATPVELPIEAENRRSSYPPPAGGPAAGTGAAEISAWAAIAQKPGAPSGPSLGWMVFSVLVIGGAVALAYYLASRG